MLCSDIYPELENYLMNKKGVDKDYKAEWNWTRFLIKGKMFAAICDDGGQNALLNIKVEPEFGEFLRRVHEDINEGYYMNKEHWCSVKLTGTVPYEVVKDMCDRGYRLIMAKLPKKIRLELTENF